MADVSFVTSSLLTEAGIKHGWFTRSGGVSTDSFESLNIKYGMSDPDGNIRENRRRGLASLDSDLDHLSFIRHEHGTTLIEATVSAEDQTADASFSTESDIVLGQGTADCPTLILAIPQRLVALIHAGWRGLQAGIIPKAISELTERNQIRPQDLRVGVGPMACGRCYEFGPEGREIFGDEYITERDGKLYLDMPRLVHDQLAQAGVNEIDNLRICTIEDKRFFSYRRDKDERGECGRFLTAAVLPKT